MEQWKINRAGLVDFWYYDEEEFEFEEGRLLLRGSNGSGKSVTMQSFIPLLLDGNKTPSRLDPFGSKARKMDNYLIGEDIDQDERTGYLYLEFIKPEANMYMTIGMGMRARKNKPLDSWYFVITDGRRIGKDFLLYKKMGEKIALTKKELQNRIAEGGNVLDSQKEYMKVVNDLLFGYEDVNDYDELIKLLIQLRSPKLSKDFKPTVIYEIMTNALQMLTEEDLRPMSEAIENMDNIKSNLEMLENSKRAADRILNSFNQYNEFILAQKSELFMKATKDLNNNEKKLKETEKIINYNEDIMNSHHKELNDLQQEKSIIEEQQKNLQQLDAYKIQNKIEDITKQLISEKEIETNKQRKLNKEKDDERSLHYAIKELQDKIDEIQDELLEKLEEMGEDAESASFDEHFFFYDEIRKKTNDKYDFSYIMGEMKKYKQKLKASLDALKEEKRRKKNHDEQLQKADKARKDTKENQKKNEELQLLFTEIKEEFMEKIYNWQQNNTQLKVQQEKMGEISIITQLYGENKTYDDILYPIREGFNQNNIELNTKISEKNSEKKQINKMYQQLESEYLRWKSKKDPEPDRVYEVIKNRQRLTEKNIPFIPLYKAFDFKEDIEENFKGIIEEALMDMGVLDALIIPPKYEKKVLAADENLKDKYIFSDPQFLQYEISNYLKIEKSEIKGITLEILDNVLKSFLIDQTNNKTFISKEGIYGLGILRGKVSGKYMPQFIGVEARKQYRLKILDDLQQKMDEKNLEIKKIQIETKELENKIEILNEEFRNFPKKEDIETASKQLEESNMLLNFSKNAQENEELKANSLFKELQKAREATRILVQKLTLNPKINIIEESIEAIEEYGEKLNQFQLDQDKLLRNNEIKNLKLENKEKVEIRIEDLSGDLGKLNNLISKLEKDKENLKEQLKQDDIEEIKLNIEHCIKRSKEIPGEREDLIEKESSLKKDIEFRQKECLSLKEKKKHYYEIKQVYELGFINEYKLSYVEEGEIKDSLSCAKKIYDTLSYLLKLPKIKNDYEMNLQEKYHKNFGSLVEYNLEIYQRIFEVQEIDENIIEAMNNLKRVDIKCRFEGKEVNFIQLIALLEERIHQQKSLLNDSDRHLFEDILIHSISRIISAKIWNSQEWVKKMNTLMASLKTSSGLTFNLVWKKKKAESEEQLATGELVDILQSDPRLLHQSQKDKITKHFRSKIEEARSKMYNQGQSQTFLSIVKEVLDYRQWFEFQLSYTKTNEKRKELTNNAFFTFSGGEKAMAMYVPLFSAVYARYDGARGDCPRIISLDEAFAGVDENNISDMFRLLIELDLSFVINSQILWGDYDTVPSLSICELIRPDNAKFVTVIRYHWNGKSKELVLPKTENIDGDEGNVQ